MKNLSSGESLDRLSKLPDSSIFEIFWLLPMREVVRTSLLSKRWKNLWKNGPNLNFKDCLIGYDIDGLRKFINLALMLWRGTRILKLKIDFKNSSKSCDIDLWVRFAMEYGVEVFYVFGLENQNCWVAPQCLYSCSSLRMLYLRGCNLQIPINNVNWNQLTHLRIECFVLGDDLINKVLSGSPKLQVLVLLLMGENQNITIQSTSLKHLYIHIKYFSYRCMDTELRISTSNLQILELVGFPFRKCLMMNNAPGLTRANLYWHHLSYGNDFTGETLSQILPTIQHAKELGLSDCCIKALVDINKGNMLSPFPNVRLLNLKGCFEEYEQIVRLLQIFPEVKILQLLPNENAYKQSHGRELVKFEPNLPNSFLQQLRTIVITRAVGENSIFPVIEILLKYASKLEKMVFQAATPVEKHKVLRMPRSSPTAELIF